MTPAGHEGLRASKALGHALAVGSVESLFKSGQVFLLLLLDMLREVLHEGFEGWEEVRRVGIELLKGIEFVFDLETCLVLWKIY